MNSTATLPSLEIYMTSRSHPRDECQFIFISNVFLRHLHCHFADSVFRTSIFLS